MRIVDISLHSCTHAEQKKCRFDTCAVRKSASTEIETESIRTEAILPPKTTLTTGEFHFAPMELDGVEFMRSVEIEAEATTTEPPQLLDKVARMPEVLTDADNEKYYIDAKSGHKVRYHAAAWRQVVKEHLDAEVDTILRSINGESDEKKTVVVENRKLIRHKRQERQLDGVLPRDTVLDEGDYLVNQDLIVPKDVTLTLRPGVTMKFKQDVALIVRGEI